jgi:hypothetical protein
MFLSNFEAARQVAEEQSKDRLHKAEHHRLVRLITGDRRSWLSRQMSWFQPDMRSGRGNSSAANRAGGCSPIQHQLSQR